MCNEKNQRRESWLSFALTALWILGPAWLLFPLGLDSAWYMTLVPLGVRLLLIGILLPLLALLGRYRTGRTAEELLVRTAPRLGPVLHKASALLLGPLGLMPLTAFLASRLWSSLLGVEGVWPVLLGSVLPLLAAGALAAVRPRNAGRRAAGVLAGVALLLLAAGALAALSGGSFPASPAVDPFPLEALDCHVGFMFLLAPAALPVLRAGGREETGKDALKSRPFRQPCWAPRGPWQQPSCGFCWPPGAAAFRGSPPPAWPPRSPAPPLDGASPAWVYS